MIGIFLGQQDSGKTLTMSYHAKRYYDSGYEIYSNYGLKFKHTKLNKELLKDYVEKRKQFNKAVFCIDEIYLIFDSRNFGQKFSKIFSYLILQSSKRDCIILGTAQWFNTIDKRFRDNTTFMCFCSRVLKTPEGYRELKASRRLLSPECNEKLYIKNQFYIRTVDSYDTRAYYLKAQPCFGIYNTKELLAVNE